MFLPGLFTADYTMPVVAGPDTVTLGDNVDFLVGGVLFNTHDMAGRAFTMTIAQTFHNGVAAYNIDQMQIIAPRATGHSECIRTSRSGSIMTGSLQLTIAAGTTSGTPVKTDALTEPLQRANTPATHPKR